MVSFCCAVGVAVCVGAAAEATLPVCVPASRRAAAERHAHVLQPLLLLAGLYEAELESQDGSVFYLRQVGLCHDPWQAALLSSDAGRRILSRCCGVVVLTLTSLALCPRLRTPCPLPQEAPHALRSKTAEDICASPVVGFGPLERVSTVLQVLRDTPHSGFPVLAPCKGGYASQRASLDGNGPGGPGGPRGNFEGGMGSGDGVRDSVDGGGRTAGRLQGFVLRSQVGIQGCERACWLFWHWPTKSACLASTCVPDPSPPTSRPLSSYCPHLPSCWCCCGTAPFATSRAGTPAPWLATMRLPTRRHWLMRCRRRRSPAPMVSASSAGRASWEGQQACCRGCRERPAM